MTGWRALWHLEFLGSPLGAWTLALATSLVTFTVLPLVTGFISARRRRLISPGPPGVHFAIDLTALLIERTSRVLLWAVAVWLGSRHLTLAPRLERWLTIALVLLFWMQAALWAMTAVRYAIDVRRQRSSGPDTLLKSSMAVILFAAGIVIWGLALLLALGNLGVKIEPLLAGLGIGGIALALAVQTVLADLLASLSIALDKPFGLGDFLGVDAAQGTVEHIGVKSTRLRSLSGEQMWITTRRWRRSRRCRARCARSSRRRPTRASSAVTCSAAASARCSSRSSTSSPTPPSSTTPTPSSASICASSSASAPWK